MLDIARLPEVRFPDGFLWGSATAGHQVEGDNVHSQLWHEEQARPPEARSGRACDHWNRYAEDIDLIAELGHQAYRMSVEWSRIEPRQGEHDAAALECYRDILRRLTERGIRPWVTLVHFTHPQWFEELGAWRRRENVDRFLRHVDFLVPRIAEYVDGWITFNEFNLNRAPDAGDVKSNILRAHAGAFAVIRRHSRAPVGTAHAFVQWFPYRYEDPFDRAMTEYLDFATHGFFFNAVRTGELVYPHRDAEEIPGLKGSCDYWGVNYYVRIMVDARKAGLEGARFRHSKLRLIDMEFAHDEWFPEGLIACLDRVRDRPVYITENGCACDDDRWRVVHMVLHLCALREAMDRGADARGYFHWSLMDNYEWGSYQPRFGLVHVDFETFRRTPKPSAAFYREVIRNGGFSGADAAPWWSDRGAAS
jgi:beta-glucosidase